MPEIQAPERHSKTQVCLVRGEVRVSSFQFYEKTEDEEAAPSKAGTFVQVLDFSQLL